MLVTVKAKKMIQKIIAANQADDLIFADQGEQVVAQLISHRDEQIIILQTLSVNFQNQTFDTVLDVCDGQLVVRDR